MEDTVFRGHGGMVTFTTDKNEGMRSSDYHRLKKVITGSAWASVTAYLHDRDRGGELWESYGLTGDKGFDYDPVFSELKTDSAGLVERDQFYARVVDVADPFF